MQVTSSRALYRQMWCMNDLIGFSLLSLLIQTHHSRKPLNKRRVRIVIGRVKRIWTHCPKVLQMNFAQSTLQLLAHPQVDGEFIGLKLTLAAVNCHEVAQCLFNGGPDSLEEKHQGNDCRDCSSIIVKSKCTIKLMRIVA